MKSTYYYSGGLAEFVVSPSPRTFSYFSKWFTGAQSLGRAMKLIGLPYQKKHTSILEKRDEQVVVNLQYEQQTLYDKTLFSYKKQRSIDDQPQLTFDFHKAISLVNWWNTGVILVRQIQWIAFPEKTVEKAKDWMNEIPGHVPLTTEKIEQELVEIIWPRVLAIGMLAEFYHHLIQSSYRNDPKIESYMMSQIARKDWFFHSLRDQKKVASGEMTMDEYLEQYGMRSDKDYDIDSPRWYEIKGNLEKRIKHNKFPEQKDDTVHDISHKDKKVHAAVQLQILRNDAKKKVLLYIDGLRKSLPTTNARPSTDIKKSVIKESIQTSGHGRPISPGVAVGKTVWIHNAHQKIPTGSIGVFLNASPEYGMQFNQCNGCIFITGGMTSHGAIVAREFGVPALTDPSAKDMIDGLKVELNGTQGTWKVLES